MHLTPFPGNRMQPLSGFHRFFAAAGLALALLAGQQAVLLHDLRHAVERVAGRQDPGQPAEKSCDTHFACAQLSSAVGTSLPVLALSDSRGTEEPAAPANGAPQRTRLAFRSRAPPALSA